jgi:hypothetical protein
MLRDFVSERRVVVWFLVAGRWWIDAMEATFDWVLAGIALSRYLTMG